MKKQNIIIISGIIILLIVMAEIYYFNVLQEKNKEGADLKSFPQKLSNCASVELTNYIECTNNVATSTCNEGSPCWEILLSDPTYECTEKKKSLERDTCYFQLAEEYKNISVCGLIMEDSSETLCEKEVKQLIYFDKNLIEEDGNYSVFFFFFQECNSYVSAGLVGENCMGYQYFNRGCYYDYNAKNCPNYGGGLKLSLDYYGISTEESEELCYEFINSGMTADCLRTVSEDKTLCLEFAGEDEYLLSICNLVGDEVLDEMN